MADLGGQFDSSTVEPMGEMTPLPAGEYRCCCIKSEWKPTKNGNGEYLEFSWQVLEGPCAKRMVFSRLNLKNPSPVAVEIARSELSAICNAAGKIKLRDSSELHDIPVVISVAIKRREDNGQPGNEVKGYKSVKAASENKAAAPAAPAGAAASGEAPKPSWA